MALAGVMLMWSALVNGRPAVFPDTALYYSEAEYLAGAIGLAPTVPAPARDPTALPLTPGTPNVSATIDGARSPIYAAFLYGLERLGGLWLVAGVQSGLVAFVLYLLFRAAAPGWGDGAYLAWMAGLSVFTSLPFFSSFIMPDVFGGVSGVATVLVLTYWDRLSGRSRAAVVALLVFSLAVHRSNLLTIIAVTMAGSALLARIGFPRRRWMARAQVLAASCLASCVAGALAFIPIAGRAGEPVRNPPFLMARVLADGPGRSYLRFACAHGRAMAVCRYSGLPPEDSDTLLWSSRRATGLFGVSDYRTRLRLEAEEPSFVLGVLAYAPLDQLEASMLNGLRQLAMTHVKSPLADPGRYVQDGYWRRTSLPHIIPNAETCMTPGRCASRLSPTALGWVHDATLTLSLLGASGALAWVLSRPDIAAGLRRRALDISDDRVRITCALLLVAGLVLANALVCGALSAPVARYQARLIWLLPAVTMLSALVLFRPAAAWARLNAGLPPLLQRFPKLNSGAQAA